MTICNTLKTRENGYSSKYEFDMLIYNFLKIL